jgi:hypothetical protein
MLGVYCRHLLNNKLLHGWHLHIWVMRKFMEPTFLVVVHALIKKSHVNIGKYIKANNWRTCECYFIKFLPILVWCHQVTSRMLITLWNFMKLVEVVVGWSIDFSFSIRKVNLKCLWCLTRNQACLQTSFQSFNHGYHTFISPFDICFHGVSGGKG